MNRDQFLANIAGTFAKAYDLLKRKNSDYAGDGDPFKNFKNAHIAGVTVEKAILVRISDKLARLGNLLSKEEAGIEAAVIEETIEDTAEDAINYLAIFLAYRASKKQ